MPPRKPEGVIPDNLTDLKDVDDTVTRQDGHTIHWDAARQMWVPGPGGGGVRPWMWAQRGTPGPVGAALVDNLGGDHGDPDISWDVATPNRMTIHTVGIYAVTLVAQWATTAATDVYGFISCASSQPDIQDPSDSSLLAPGGGAANPQMLSYVVPFDEAAMTDPGGTGWLVAGASVQANGANQAVALSDFDFIVVRIA